MKKLLGILGTIAIAGSGVAGFVGNAPAPTKTEINSLQTNNLEKLNRNKRKNDNHSIVGILKVVITTNEDVSSSGVVLNNKVYFGSSDHNVYEYNPETGQQKIVITTNGAVRSSGVVLNNKIYFGSYDHKVYEYDPTTGQQKIVITTNGAVRSSGVVLNNKIYFGSYDHKVYEYDPTTGQQKIVITTNGAVRSSGIVLNNKLYFWSNDHKVYEYDPTTGQQKIVITTNGAVRSSGIVLNNKLYFWSNDHKVYEYDPTTGQQKIVITTSSTVTSYSGIILNNKVYFGSSDHNVYEYNPETGQQKIVITTNGAVFSSGVVLNNKIYFGSYDHKVYEYEPLELIESDVINLEEQLIRGIFLYYKRQNYNFQIRNISNIDLNNLNFVETKAIKTFSKPEQRILLPYYNYHEEKPNNSKKEIIYNSPDDEISVENTKSIEIQKGLSTTHGKTKTETKTTGYTGSFGITLGAEAEAKIFGIGASFSAELRTDHSFSNENSNSTEIMLENSFNTSNTRKEEAKQIQKKTIKSQQISIPSEKKLIYNSKVYKYNCEDVWNLTKKINGSISALIFDENNNSSTFNSSIKEIMNLLKINSLLPKEITINDQDNSITWTGEIVAKYTCGFEQDSSTETKLVDL